MIIIDSKSIHVPGDHFSLIECTEKDFHLTSFKSPFPRTAARSYQRFMERDETAEFIFFHSPSLV